MTIAEKERARVLEFNDRPGNQFVFDNSNSYYRPREYRLYLQKPTSAPKNAASLIAEVISDKCIKTDEGWIPGPILGSINSIAAVFINPYKGKNTRSRPRVDFLKPDVAPGIIKRYREGVSVVTLGEIVEILRGSNLGLVRSYADFNRFTHVGKGLLSRSTKESLTQTGVAVINVEFSRADSMVRMMDQLIEDDIGRFQADLVRLTGGRDRAQAKLIKTKTSFSPTVTPSLFRPKSKL